MERSRVLRPVILILRWCVMWNIIRVIQPLWQVIGNTSDLAKYKTLLLQSNFQKIYSVLGAKPQLCQGIC